MPISLETTLRNLGFPSAQIVEGRASIADLYPKDKRCGIYVLHFKTGEYYVGQAVDVVRRYAQHCHNHPDIVSISFKIIPQNALDNEERQVVYALEKEGYRLRNILIVTMPSVETDFDLIMLPEEQQRWLTDLNFIDLAGDRIVNEELRHRHTGKYQQFCKYPQSWMAVNVVRKYVQCCVPAVTHGEVSFWSCTCMRTSELLIRLNVGWQTVFDVFATSDGISCRWYLTRNLTTEALGKLHTMFWLNISDSALKAGGGDQITFKTKSYDQTQEYLQNPNLILVLRKFNLGLMKKVRHRGEKSLP